MSQIKPGDTVFIVKRARVLAGQPPIEGVVANVLSVQTKSPGCPRVIGVEAKISSGRPQLFPTRQVCATKAQARTLTTAILNDAEDDALIAYRAAQTLINKARIEEANRPLDESPTKAQE